MFKKDKTAKESIAPTPSHLDSPWYQMKTNSHSKGDSPMPSEYRMIFFEPAEISKGAVEWKRSQGGKVPVQKIVRMEVDSETLNVKFHFAEGKDVVPPLELRSEEVKAALLTYCRKAKIPLPMRASKNLVRQGDQLAFLISLPTELAPPTVPVEYT